MNSSVFWGQVKDLIGKLKLQMSLDWWDFSNSVIAFFVHWTLIICSFTVVFYKLTSAFNKISNRFKR